MAQQYGKVYLVGSGPGDPELMTLKARRLLDTADVIVFDQLPGEKILASMPEAAEKIDAGKHAGDHNLTQSEINDAIVEKAKEGKMVVRLKGGDPYMFGRGGEEAEELVKAGIEFEIVPGITSALAATAYAGIPVTHRDHASMVTFITGHEDPTKEETALDWKTLAAFGGTIVIFMGVKMLERNMGELMKNGKDPKTPVAMVERGTRPDQRVTIGTVETIAKISKDEGVKAPALTVIGDVVKLHEILGSQI
ncbi:uroporphyrinogen-III C-methyltransferase [Methanococcoides seepicolus]|jgi:uroporphyrin-III C-methyltransferase|uniref:uroporphyrinogen-III C-methyltransferase n=1 Tax=Methanococcoides seepicolus TaxID=2828780 RepID=A0A9E4ZEN5_9EURY|nr:uroporphyrinogen-III C-methyltransferase [Methanococcoides seepicolus]MCM1985549.1 uroporphyrinogen-III C-methyltransferase [Methanococcoides seepicolus]